MLGSGILVGTLTVICARKSHTHTEREREIPRWSVLLLMVVAHGSTHVKHCL